MKTHADIGLEFWFDVDKEKDDSEKGFAIGLASSWIFDASSLEIKENGDANFLSFYFAGKESDNTQGKIEFGFLLYDHVDMFHDAAFRIVAYSKVANNLYVSGGIYLDRDKNTKKRHDMPLFGLSYHFG